MCLHEIFLKRELTSSLHRGRIPLEGVKKEERERNFIDLMMMISPTAK